MTVKRRYKAPPRNLFVVGVELTPKETTDVINMAVAM
jgi:hypothetical protein